jgi:tetratricopeptide (TPR) repeat protein
MTHVLNDFKAQGRKSIIPIVCAIAFAILLMPGHLTATGTDSHFSQLVQQGKDAEAAGNLDEAIARYQEALKISPSSPLPQTKLAAIYFNRKDFEQALAYCEHVLAANPRDATAAGLAGMAAYQLNRYTPAAKYLQTALAVQSHDSQLHYWLGMTLYALLDARHALDEFYRARLYNPKDTEVLYMIGKIHWEMCRQAWEEMVRVDPDSVRVKQMVAEQDEIKNLYPEAIAKYQEIIQQQPNGPGFHYALGKLYLHITKFPEAEEAFQAELKLDPHSAWEITAWQKLPLSVRTYPPRSIMPIGQLRPSLTSETRSCSWGESSWAWGTSKRRWRRLSTRPPSHPRMLLFTMFWDACTRTSASAIWLQKPTPLTNNSRVNRKGKVKSHGR